MPNPNVGLFSAPAMAETCSIEEGIVETEDFAVKEAFSNSRVGVYATCDTKTDDTGAYILDACGIGARVYSACFPDFEGLTRDFVLDRTGNSYGGVYCYCTVESVGAYKCAVNGDIAIWVSPGSSSTADLKFASETACSRGCREACMDRMNRSTQLFIERACGEDADTILNNFL